MKLCPLRPPDNLLQREITTREIAAHTSRACMGLKVFVLPVNRGDQPGRKPVLVTVRNEARQPVPNLTEPPMENWRQGVGHGFRRGFLEPPLPAFGVIFSTGHRNAGIPRSALADTDASQHEELFPVLVAKVR